MSAGNAGHGDTSLPVQCEKFSANPPNERQLDRLWYSYARSPARAFQDFDTHFPNLNGAQPLRPAESEDVSGRLKVTAAFGGIQLASEAGDPRAQDAYREIIPRIRRIGHTALDILTQPLTHTTIEGVGSALAIYLAANATDISGYTSWVKSARPGPYQDRSRQTRRDPHTLGPAQSQEPQSLDALGLSRLQAKFQKRDIGRLGVIAYGFAEIAYMTGAYARVFKAPHDRIAGQHVRNFVTTCLRLANTTGMNHPTDIEKTKLLVAKTLDPYYAEMFSTGLQLLNERKIPIKSPDTLSMLDQPSGRGDTLRLRDEHDKTRNDIMRLSRRDVERKFNHLLGIPTNDEEEDTIEIPLGTGDYEDKPPLPHADRKGPTTVEGVSSFHPRILIEGSIPVSPSDTKWIRKFKAEPYLVINHENPKAPILKVYPDKRTRTKGEESIKLTTPGNDTVFLGADDIVLVYTRDKNGNISKKPVYAFQGIDDGMPEGFRAEDMRKLPLVRINTDNNDKIDDLASRMPKVFGRKAVGRPLVTQVSKALTKLSPTRGQSRQILTVPTRKEYWMAYVVYPTIGKPDLYAIAPDGTLVQGGKHYLVELVRLNSVGYRESQGFSTIGRLIKHGGFITL